MPIIEALPDRMGCVTGHSWPQGGEGLIKSLDDVFGCRDEALWGLPAEIHGPCHRRVVSMPDRAKLHGKRLFVREWRIRPAEVRIARLVTRRDRCLVC